MRRRKGKHSLVGVGGSLFISKSSSCRQGMELNSMGDPAQVIQTGYSGKEGAI